jgi:hypothetical protein
MAIFVSGMKCSISGQPIDNRKDAVAFPPFVANEADPLHAFSDAVIHADVFRIHPLATEAQARFEEAQQRTEPGNRRCLICGQLVTDPDNYLGLGYLIETRSDPLYLFNYAHFHRSCLATWKGLSGLITDLERLDKSGDWKGAGLKRLMSALRSVCA